MRLSLSGSLLATSAPEPFPTDDIDRLFEKLQRLEPPEDIVQQVLKRLKLRPSSERPAADRGPSLTPDAPEPRREAAE